jgi:tetraacyldisaccharide 4'-kinase
MKVIRYILFPLSILYGLITACRNLGFNTAVLKSVKFDLPIISVGNLSAGGTGKSPHIEYLIKLLMREFNVATLSRGYGRSISGFHLVDEDSTIIHCGDEPLQFKNKFPDIPIAVNKSRVLGVIELLKNKPDVNCILLDDAYQHRAITPSFSILLTEYNRPFFKDYMLPTGNLREWSLGKKRADVIIVTKSPEQLTNKERNIFIKKIKAEPHQSVYFSTLKYGQIKPMNTGESFDSLSMLKDYQILLVTGIANPMPLVSKLHAEELDFKHLKFKDHHPFRQKDIQHIRNIFDTFGARKIILTTEKDIQRLRLADKNNELAIHYVKIEVELLGDETTFETQIINHVRKNKTNSGAFS